MAIDPNVACALCGYKHSRGDNVTLEGLRKMLEDPWFSTNCIYASIDQIRVVLEEIDRLHAEVEQLKRRSNDRNPG